MSAQSQSTPIETIYRLISDSNLPDSLLLINGSQVYGTQTLLFAPIQFNYSDVQN